MLKIITIFFIGLLISPSLSAKICKSKMIISPQTSEYKYDFIKHSKNNSINNKKRLIRATVIINNPSDMEKLKKEGIKILSSKNTSIQVEIQAKMLSKLSSLPYVKRVIINN